MAEKQESRHLILLREDAAYIFHFHSVEISLAQIQWSTVIGSLDGRLWNLVEMAA